MEFRLIFRDPSADAYLRPAATRPSQRQPCRRGRSAATVNARRHRLPRSLARLPPLPQPAPHRRGALSPKRAGAPDAQEGGAGRGRHPGGASMVRAGGRCPGRRRSSRRRARLFSELRCEEPPRVRHIGARAAAAARCSSFSSLRGRAGEGTSAPPGGKRGEEAARCREETETSGARVPPRPPPAPLAMARRPGGP
ncbi:bcl-2-binding component 3, isoforms 3/4-like [Rhea pennata]|uniref:bcl-2-binding component 3, isoforms 3/4-like n=1 Tax=Rhea pennata TaxID=8795 RepID=UPI002E26DAA7